MPRVMLYCQYLSGMGHLVRSTQVAKALLRHFDVTFVSGGPPITGFRMPEGVAVRQLPPLWLEDGVFRVPEGSGEVADMKAARTAMLIATFDAERPQAIVTEFFPFGRHDLLFELEPWLDHVRRVAPHTLIVSSLRDLIGKTVLGEQTDRIVKLVNRWFDLVLVHADPSFQRFAESFPAVDALQPPVFHTGFVAEPAPANAIDVAGPQVLVSVGGGRIGLPLLEAALGAARQLQNTLPHEFRLFTGPFLEDAAFARLQAAAAGQPNVRLARFTPSLLAHMAQADLSLSLAGYNTVMNILTAGVPAVLSPIGHYGFDVEQAQRAGKLAARGLAAVVAPEELGPERLAAEVCAGLKRPRAVAGFDLNGAAYTANVIAAHLAMRATSRQES